MKHLDGRSRQNMSVGNFVEIVQKHHQRTGELTKGKIKRILTKTTFHPHGIKVELQSGEIGRVQAILESK